MDCGERTVKKADGTLVIRHAPGCPNREPGAVINVPDECSHADYLSAECEGWENPTEPLSIRVTCGRCGKHVDVRVEDPSLLDWGED